MTDGKTYTRSVALNSLPDFIEKHGADPETLFHEVGLDIHLLKNPQSYISWPRSCDLLEHAARTLSLPDLGLLWAYEVPDDLSNTGPSLYLANLMPDVISLVDMILKYQEIHTNGKHYSYSLDHKAGKITGHIDFHPETPACRQYTEHIMAIVRLGVSRFIGPPFDKPLELKLQHSAPDDLALHHKVFGCPIVFNAQRTEMSYDIRVLDKKMSQRGKMLKPLFNLYLKHQQKKLPKNLTPIISAVTDLMPYVLSSGRSDIKSVSHVLNMSPKKMQRLLKEEGTNYSALRDSVRAQITKRMLFESDMSITNIASLLGYASTVPFANACKRWYALSPRELRKSLRYQDDT